MSGHHKLYKITRETSYSSVGKSVLYLRRGRILRYLTQGNTEKVLLPTVTVPCPSRRPHVRTRSESQSSGALYTRPRERKPKGLSRNQGQKHKRRDFAISRKEVMVYTLN